MRESSRAVGVGAPDLPERGDEDVVPQGIDLVEEDHERSRRRRGPGLQRRPGDVGPGERGLSGRLLAPALQGPVDRASGHAEAAGGGAHVARAGVEGPANGVGLHDV